MVKNPPKNLNDHKDLLVSYTMTVTFPPKVPIMILTNKLGGNYERKIIREISS